MVRFVVKMSQIMPKESADKKKLQRRGLRQSIVVQSRAQFRGAQDQVVVTAAPLAAAAFAWLTLNLKGLIC